MNKRAEGYRRLGHECLELASRASIPSTEQTRLMLIEMARVWSRLADEQDMAPAPLTQASENTQPATQQQQQHQGQPKEDDD